MMRPMGKNNGSALSQVCGWEHADILWRGIRFCVLGGGCFPLFEIFLNYVLISEEWDLSKDHHNYFGGRGNINESFHQNSEWKKAHEEALL